MVAALLCAQLIQQLDEELGIEKFRAELESTQVLVRRATCSCTALLHCCMSVLKSVVMFARLA
jgi:hypothetical protein